jgi:hypothetical protein
MFRKMFGKREASHEVALQRERREPTFGDAPDTGPNAPVDTSRRTQSDLADRGAEILHKLMISHYTDDDGIHLETVLSAAAACAGYQAQRAALWLIATDQPEANAFPDVNEVATASGDLFVVSELVNQLLASDADSDRLTVLKLVGSGGMRAGGTRLPDVTDIAARTDGACGTENYPPLTVPPEHVPEENARVALQRWWPVVTKIFSADEFRQVNPLDRMLALSAVTGRLIEAGQDAVDPDIAMQLAMETAWAMAKVTGIRSELPS